jgi:hypothetical protein
MSGDVTLCFYIVVGVSVAVAVWIRDTSPNRSSRVFRASTAIVFWPMYLPLLLVANRTMAIETDEIGNRPRSHGSDELAAAISEAETDLDRALESLDHWPDVASFVETDRFADLRLAWNRKADEIRELDRLLAISESQTQSAKTESPLTISAPTLAAESHDANADSATAGRIASSEKSRRENLTELNLVRQQWHGDLLESLAQVRQLVSLIHLGRYTGKPASRAAELVQQIAHTVVSLDAGAKRPINDRQPLPAMANRTAL